jgi:hypothetical protein
MHKVLRMLPIVVAWSLLVAADARADQTIVFFRHGEKPSGGYGQLTCQGLNRALALPDVLLSRFPTPSYLYAPDPGVKIPDPVGSVHYVRPLATIEPTAIRVGLGVNTSYGYNNIAGLRDILIRSYKANTTAYVAWEHAYLVKAVQSIMDVYGGGVAVPAWPSGDYDSLYIVHVTYHADGSAHASFETSREGLDGQATTCP